MLENFQILQHLPLNASQLGILSLPGLVAQQDLLSIWHTNKEGSLQKDVFVWQPQEQRFKQDPSKLRYNAVSLFIRYFNEMIFAKLTN